MNEANKPNALKKEENKNRLIEELQSEKCCGNVTVACKRLGLGRTAAYDWRNEDADFKLKWDSAVKAGREQFADEAEYALRTQALKGNVIALIFSLKNLRPNEWRDRKEIRHEVEELPPLDVRLVKAYDKAEEKQLRGKSTPRIKKTGGRKTADVGGKQHKDS